MIFKFLQKKIVLDCFTSRSYAIEYAPINYAIKNIPDWWKSLPSSYRDGHQPKLTMKSCVGMVDYYVRSVAILLWCDLSIIVNADKSYSWNFSDNTTKAQIHPMDTQATNFLSNYGHMKILSPWLFRSEKNVDWVWSHPSYNYSNSNNVVSLPGISNFYHQHSTNINMMIHLNQEKSFLIPYGEPLALLTPMSDRKVEIVRHLVSEQEYFNLYQKGSVITFVDKYKNMLKSKDQFSSCPYHNHIEEYRKK